jgi:hypothetical protein
LSEKYEDQEEQIVVEGSDAVCSAP